MENMTKVSPTTNNIRKRLYSLTTTLYDILNETDYVLDSMVYKIESGSPKDNGMIPEERNPEVGEETSLQGLCNYLESVTGKTERLHKRLSQINSQL